MSIAPWGVVGGAAAAGLTWGWCEARAFATRRVTVPVLPPGSPSLRVLHLSDLHLTPGQTSKARWVSSLAREDVDLVVDTGDNLAHRDAVPAVLEALDGLLDVPGVFVHGSNDYYAPHAKNPFGYFAGPSRVRKAPETLPTHLLTEGFVSRGWRDLNNARAEIEIHGLRISLVGLDDPHVGRDSMPQDSASRGDVHLGVVHAPYRRALSALRQDGAELALAGHTHGGQVCLPGWGALVTNCDLDTRRAKGLHRWHEGVDSGESVPMWMHVSAGIGTSPYVPLRFACRPEATVLTLVSRPAEGG